MTEQSFEFKDGSSNKFWTISHSGSTYRVHFGRIGTNGQVQVKECASEAEAQDLYHKLIAEKLKKGYVRTAGNSVQPPQSASSPCSNPAPNPAPLPSQPAIAVIEKPAFRQPAEVRINLEPHDWFWAHWRNNHPLQKPEPRPFALDRAMEMLHEMPAEMFQWKPHWDTTRDPVNWSRAESIFWQAAVHFAWSQENSTNPDCKQFGTRCDLKKFSGKLPHDYENDIDVIYRPLGQRAATYASALSIPMVMGWSDDEVLQAISTQMLRRQHACAYWMYRVPYMSASQLASMRQRLLPLLQPPVQSKRIAGDFMLAAALGMHEVVRTALTKFPKKVLDGEVRHNYDIPKFVFGLNDPREVESEMSRLGLLPIGVDEIAGWIAHTEGRQIQAVVSTLNHVSGFHKLDAIRMIGRIESPETAKVMYQLYRNTDYQDVCNEWFERFPHYGLPAMMSEFEKAGNDQEEVKIMLRDYVERLDAACLDPVMLERLKRAGISEKAASKQPIDDQLTELLQAARKDKRPKLPQWTTFTDNQLQLGSFDLTQEQLETVLGALQQSSPESIHPLVKHLRSIRHGDVFDRFCWKLFKFWLRAGAVPKEKWAMLSIGYLGSDALLNSLLPKMYFWRETGNHQRAFYGLECFRLCGTDAAIMKVHEISQSPALRSLRGKAVEYMQKIAEDRGMTASELEDRIVPTCGLDESGRREFDFGPRKFCFVLSPDLKPMIKDENGLVKSDLPAASQKDDAALAATAHSSWKAIKKELRTVAKMQAWRLELAMVTGRRWTVDEFNMFLLRHPLMSHIARRLVWAAHDANGNMFKTFRALDDGSLAGEDDRATTLDGAYQVSIVHPFHLSAETSARWGEVFSDYEIIAPFQQLGRPLYFLEESGARLDMIIQFEKLLLPAVSIGSTLDRLGWWRGSPQQRGCVSAHSKYFYRQEITAVVEYHGYYVGYPQDSEDQAIEKCYFIKGKVKTDDADEHQRMPLAEVEKLIISEVLHDLTILTSKVAAVQ